MSAASPQKNHGGYRFPKGQSGNPAGKPKGTRSRFARAAEVLLDGETETLTRKAIDLALEGDTIALRLCMERVMPPRKGRPIEFELPKLETADDLVSAIGAVLHACSRAQLSPDEASTIVAIIDVKRRAIETVELEKRLAALEGRATE
jgi:hypothetical protein